MKKMMLFCLMVVVLGSLGACSPSKDTKSIVSAGAWIDAIDHFPQRGAARCMSVEDWEARHTLGFDVNQYFDVFDHLSMEPGYTLDYVYLRDGVGCKPIVYAHQIVITSYSSYSEYVSRRGYEYQASFQSVEGSNDYLDHVLIDDTPQGYLQFVMLSIVEDQFSLYWHALYNDTRIVTSVEQAQVAFGPVVVSVNDWDPQAYIQQVRRVQERIPRLDYTPTVEMEEDRAIVRLMVFSEWGGFSELRVEVSRAFPHDMLSWREASRLYFNSGKLF